MTTQQYLSQVQKFDYLIQNNIKEIERLKSLITSISVNQEKEKVQTSGAKDKIGDFCARIIDLQNEINYLENFRKEIMSELEELDADEYMALYCVYVSRVGVVSASKAIHCSRGRVYLLLKSGMANFEKKNGKKYLKLEK